MGDAPFKSPMDLRAADLQISAMAKSSHPWATARLMFTIQILAWVLAIGACVLPFAILHWELKPVLPYAVTASGHVAQLQVIDPIKFDEMLASSQDSKK